MKLFASICFLFLSGFANAQNLDSLKVDSIEVIDYERLFLVDSSYRTRYVIEDSLLYSQQMIEADLAFFEREWPHLVSKEIIGQSEFGLPLTVLRIGKGIPKKEAVFLVGNIHAREDFSSKMVMKFANLLLLSLEGKSAAYEQADSLLDFLDVYLLPLADPDGLKIVQKDSAFIDQQLASWMDSIYITQTVELWKANGKGIDLNCSFDDGNWNVKHSGNFQECRASEGFKGYGVAEPIETQAIQRFVQNKRPLVTISFHTKGNNFYWADAITHPRFSGIDEVMVKDAAEVSHFFISKISKMPADFGCGLENYVRSKLGAIGVCVELSASNGSKEQWPDEAFNEQVWVRASEIPMSYIRNAVRYREKLVQLQFPVVQSSYSPNNE